MSNVVKKLKDQLVYSITKYQDGLYERLSGADDVVLFRADELQNLCNLRFNAGQADSAIIQANDELAKSSVLLAVRYDPRHRRFLVCKM